MGKAEKTKQFIIERVAPIFNKKGVQGTALSDITEATGLTKGAIYGNFADKNELARSCYEHNLKFLQRGLYRSFTGQTSSWNKLEKLLNFYIENFEEIDKHGGCPLMNHAIEADDGNDLLLQPVQQTFASWEKELIAVMKAGQENREFKQTANIEGLAKLFIATLEGAILVARSTNSISSFREILNSFSPLLEKELKI